MKHKFVNLSVEWLDNKKFELRQGTFSNYEGMIKNYIDKFFEDIYVEDVDVEILNDFKYKYENKISEKTLRNLFTIINGTLEYAIQLKLININYAACIKLKKGISKKIDVLSEDEEERLYNIAKDKYYIGIILGLKCGLRIGEMLALTWKDVDFNKKTIFINKSVQRCKVDNNGKPCSHKIGKTKSEASIRKVPLNDEVTQILLSYKEISKAKTDKSMEDQFVISSKKNGFILPNSYCKKLKQILEENNLRVINFHVLRHTYATRLASKRVPPKLLADIMGHTSTVTTQDYYVHPSIDDARSYL